MDLKFDQLTDTSSCQFDEMIGIYLDSFPANERQPVEIVRERIKLGKTILVIAKVEKQVVGFAIIWNFEHSDFALLDYLGVHCDWRDKKIGGKIMDEVKRLVSGWNKDLILEIENPGEGDNQVDRERRFRFYVQNGALILNNVPYLLPALDGTKPTAMMLLTIQLTVKNFYSGAKIKALIQEIYARVYQKEHNDPELRSFIHLIPEKIELIAVR